MVETRASLKRQQVVPPTKEDMLWQARQIWSRDPDKERAHDSKDKDFRAFLDAWWIFFLPCGAC